MRSNSSATQVALDELIALAALAHGTSLARSRRSTALRSGGNASRWRGRGVDFRESRIYQPGDEIRHMDWRVTARSGKPHTKLFEEEREQGLLLAMDLNPGMRFGTRVRFKSVQAARAACTLLKRTRVPKRMPGFRSIASSRPCSRSSSNSFVCGLPLRAVTRQSMWRISSPG